MHVRHLHAVRCGSQHNTRALCKSGRYSEAHHISLAPGASSAGSLVEPHEGRLNCCLMSSLWLFVVESVNRMSNLNSGTCECSCGDSYMSMNQWFQYA